MDNTIYIDSSMVLKELSKDGKTVTLMTRQIDNNWELVIQGQGNKFTTWTDWFPSAEEALHVGVNAVLRRGIDEYYSNPETEVEYEW